MDVEARELHFIDSRDSLLHVEYVTQKILGTTRKNLEDELDAINDSVYRAADRRFYLGSLSLDVRKAQKLEQDQVFLIFETVEVDTMSEDMLKIFYQCVRSCVDRSVKLYLKPANHLQESYFTWISQEEIPHVFAHALRSSCLFTPLNPGSAFGRIRAFNSEDEYRKAEPLKWYDIIVMPRVPEDIPRVSGIINARQTTPLSHTNTLAANWKIPNCVRVNIMDHIGVNDMNGRWVRYGVDPESEDLTLEPAEEPEHTADGPPQQFRVTDFAAPATTPTPIAELSELRAKDSHRYGVKAANLGELHHVIQNGSDRWFGFYQRPRPPRDNLLHYLARQLNTTKPADESALQAAARHLVRTHAHVPRGIALPFSLLRRFLASSSTVQQVIERLKACLETEQSDLDPLCAELQQLIVATRLPEDIRDEIETALLKHFSGSDSLVVRSSSNAEDLPGFSAAGLYESVTGVCATEEIFASIKEVWASLVSSRSVRLQHQAGIPLDDSYMGVIVQEQANYSVGGVMVTCNPLNGKDFRNVYMNISPSVTDVVSGKSVPLEHLYNTVEGGSRTLALGTAERDLEEAVRCRMQNLAIIGRLLQSHFSPDYAFATPADIEWVADDEVFHLLQIRPYRTVE
ncbi:PEP/pyruvate-binding domain-containing protein [Streptomyces sp. NPDC051133]|uniref:PEP/pyruvate-binding domain-containing protein n=1 Tax=Streptomyces sp. NPDC051133 TaxID=3155521 RepID=UPI0034213121